MTAEDRFLAAVAPAVFDFTPRDRRPGGPSRDFNRWSTPRHEQTSPA